ncbi:MAG: branched-chain amino acid ABC transporter substrate-binding protein [Chloroflexota bacterium]
MKLRYLGTFAMSLILVAVACNPPAATTRPATPAPATAAPVTPAPPTDAPADDPLGTRTIPAGESLHIVMWGVLSGPDSALGIDVQRGVEIAVDDRPTVAGFPVELTSEDGLCTPAGGNTAATRIAADVTVVGLVGSVCSDETVGGIELITNVGLTTISPSNTRPALTAPDRGPEFAGYLRTAHNDEFQGAKAAEFAYDILGSRRAATIHDNSSYAQALQQVFADEFIALGGEITIQTVLTDQNATSVLETVAPTTPDLIYYPVFTAPFGFITDAVRDVPGLEEVDLMAADGAFSAAAVEAGGPNALGMYLSSPDTRQFPEGYQPFLDKHQAKYNEAPLQIFHAHAYDATNILFDAIEAVAVEGADGSLQIPLGALRDAIYATENFQGITGTLTCGEFGDCGAPAIGVYQITQAIVDDPAGAWPPDPIWPEL